MSAPASSNKQTCEVLRASLALRGPPFSLWRVISHGWWLYDFAPADRADAKVLEHELDLKIRRFWSSQDPGEIEQLAGELVELDQALWRRAI